MNFFKRFKLLPISTQRLLGLGVVLSLVAALPLFVRGVVTQNFNPFKKAATGEPSVCVSQNKTIVVTPPGQSGTCHDIQSAIDAVNGDGFTVSIRPGTYNIYNTLYVTNKSNITITGDPQAGSGATDLHFISSGWGFRVSGSSGTILWMTMQGTTSNGMLSINNSPRFTLSYARLYSAASHTIDIGSSSQVNILDSDITSSAGAVEVGASNNVSISNNKIYHSSNAIAITNSNSVHIMGNLVYGNQESGLIVNGSYGSISDLKVWHNTFVNNGYRNSNFASVDILGTAVSGLEFRNNIVAWGIGPGIRSRDGGTFSVFSRNDIYGTNPNYSGYPDQTGKNGNISKDPLLNSANDIQCPQHDSPVIYGSVPDMEYMGYIGSCSTYPTPHPTASPYNYCSGNNGDECDIPSCPICPTGQRCPLIPCTITYGTCYNHFCIPNPTSTPTPSATPTPTPTPHADSFECQVCGGTIGAQCFPPLVCQSGICVKADGTSQCNQTSRPFEILFKFDGVDDGSAEGAKVSVKFVSSALGSGLVFQTSSPIQAVYTNNGIYKLTFTVEPGYLPSSGDYKIFLVGEKHLGVRFCKSSGQTTHCAETDAGQISLPLSQTSTLTLNFTGIPLPAGDVAPQYGAVSIDDFNKVTSLLSKPQSDLTANDLLVGDLNYDGRVSIEDIFLIRKTLETRYD